LVSSAEFMRSEISFAVLRQTGRPAVVSQLLPALDRTWRARIRLALSPVSEGILPKDERVLVLRYIQPGLVGLIDGTLSTLAPIFAAALLSGSHAALFVGLATAVGAGISMGFSEALSDDGTQTGRGTGLVRGIVTGVMTTLGGVFHSLPFLIGHVHTALVFAGVVVAVELIAISLIRKRFLDVSLRTSLVQVALGGALIVAVGVVLGSA
ncbi:MAG: Rubrerythrin, partial [Solirubrobacteraceae bacterium]|nr:Rubrerythrin [Solirubrobacteraceae bacterium]